MKGWIYEMAEDADFNAGSPDHDRLFYFLEIRIPINRLDLLAKQGLIRDFTRVVLEAEGSDNRPENARRVWVTINELKAGDWGVDLASRVHQAPWTRWEIARREREHWTNSPPQAVSSVFDRLTWPNHRSVGRGFSRRRLFCGPLSQLPVKAGARFSTNARA